MPQDNNKPKKSIPAKFPLTHPKFQEILESKLRRLDADEPKPNHPLPVDWGWGAPKSREEAEERARLVEWAKENDLDDVGPIPLDELRKKYQEQEKGRR